MNDLPETNPRARLVYHIHELERVEALQKQAAECVKDSFEAAQRAGFDATTLKVVLRLRKMTPEQRRERRALEAIYLAALGMLEGDPLPDEARRRLDRTPDDEAAAAPPTGQTDVAAPLPMQPPLIQAPLILKDPAEARQEGGLAAAEGKRVYDNPYPAGDPCRAAWDEGWCAQQQSHGMETPAAYQRRTAQPPPKDDKAPDEATKKGAA